MLKNTQKKRKHLSRYLYLSLALTVAAGVGFGCGLFRFFRDESALYVRMIIFGVGCAMLGRLFETLGSLRSGFHVGMLGLRCNDPADTKEEEGQL